jgi:hypothetical protein
MTTEQYIIRGVSELGREWWFYTGKGGEKWVSTEAKHAFCYDSIEAARAKALMFNRTTELHGLRFVAISGGSI